MVERDLAKVEVAGSSPVFRSENLPVADGIFFPYPGGGTGRHAGLKILFAVMRVTVRLRSWVLEQKLRTFVRSFFVLRNSEAAIGNTIPLHRRRTLVQDFFIGLLI